MIKQGVTTEFKWQKKIFSPAEVERFRKTPPAGGQVPTKHIWRIVNSSQGGKSSTSS